MNKLLILTGILGFSLFSLCSCGINEPYQTNTEILTTENNSNSNAGLANTNATNSDTNSHAAENAYEEFIKTAAHGGIFRVKLSKLASSKATNAGIKAFAKTMVRDHQNINDQLQKLAVDKKFMLPKDMTEDQQEAYGELAQLSGDGFDMKYVALMLETHDSDLEAFEYLADDSKDAELKSFALKNFTTLKSHQEKIKTISEKMG